MTKFGKQEKNLGRAYTRSEIIVYRVSMTVENFITLTSRSCLTVNDITNFLVRILSITVGLVTED